MHIIAHRGFNGRFPEMSPLAYEKALALPIHGVECDVRLSLDGEVVCTHDRTMERVAGVKKPVAGMTLAELKKLDIAATCEPERNPGGAPQQILTLGELIDMVFATEDKHLYIETKHPCRFGRILEEQVAKVLHLKHVENSERIHLISFSHAAMRRTKTLLPSIQRFYLRREWERRVNPLDLAFSRPSGFGLSIERAKFSPDLVGRRGTDTYMWTVNDPADMRWALAHGVNIMATDYPDVALETLSSTH